MLSYKIAVNISIIQRSFHETENINDFVERSFVKHTPASLKTIPAYSETKYLYSIRCQE